MKKLFPICFLSVIAILMMATPLSVVNAQEPYNLDAETQRTGDNIAYVPCGDLDVSPRDGKVDNPCGFNHFIILARRLILGWIMAGVTISALGFAYAGYLYIIAMGSEEKISHAHAIFYKTFLGFVFMLSSWLIAKTLETIFLRKEFRDRSFLITPPPTAPAGGDQRANNNAGGDGN